MPGLQSTNDRKHLLIIDLVVAFHIAHRLWVKSDWVPFAICPLPHCLRQNLLRVSSNLCRGLALWLSSPRACFASWGAALWPSSPSAATAQRTGSTAAQCAARFLGARGLEAVMLLMQKKDVHHLLDFLEAKQDASYRWNLRKFRTNIEFIWNIHCPKNI